MEQTQRTIYLKDLVFSVLHRWKAVLVAMLIGAVLLGGLEWKSGNSEVTLPVSVTPENQLKIDQYKNTIAITQELIQSHSKYLEESVIMTLDSYKAYTAGLYVSIAPESDTGLYDQTAGILHAYRTALLNDQFLKALGEEFDIAPVYMKELFTPEVTATGILNIFVRGRSLEEAEAINGFIRKTLESQQAAVSQLIVPHDLKISSFRAGPAMDKSLYDMQNTAQQKLTTLKNTVTSATTELNKLQPTQLQGGKPQPVLFAAAGAVLGAFLVAAVACVCHIGSGKVYSQRTLKDCTGLCILGRVCGKKRNVIDRWLRKAEGRAVHTQLDAIVANIANRCEGKKLLVFGAESAEAVRPLTEALCAQGIQCTLCAEPAGSAGAIRALPGCDCAVLVEKCGESLYDDVIWKKQTVEEYGKTILGCVLIDG